MIGATRTVTPEFTIWKVGGNAPGYEVELDGENIGFDASLTEAHKLVKVWARSSDLAGAGVSEVFGRNRTFIITPRFAFKRFDTSE